MIKLTFKHRNYTNASFQIYRNDRFFLLDADKYYRQYPLQGCSNRSKTDIFGFNRLYGLTLLSPDFRFIKVEEKKKMKLQMKGQNSKQHHSLKYFLSTNFNKIL